MKWREGETLSGPAGKATEVIVDLDPDDPPAWAAGLSNWLLDCPGQSPAWNHYVLRSCHLRPIDGAPGAVIAVPGATHEVLLAALDPAPPPTCDPASWQMLRPLNVVEQLQLPDDDACRALVRKAVEAILAGVLPAEPPLAGAVEPWRTTLIKTAAHLRGEEHAP